MGNSNGGGGGCNNYFCPLIEGKSYVIGFQFVMLYDSITRYDPDPDTCITLMQAQGAGPYVSWSRPDFVHRVLWTGWGEERYNPNTIEVNQFYDEMSRATFESMWNKEYKGPQQLTLATVRWYNSEGTSLKQDCYVYTPSDPYAFPLSNGYYWKTYTPNQVRYIYAKYIFTSQVTFYQFGYCPPGTWFTCKNKKVCSYLPPVVPEAWNFTENNDYFVLHPTVDGAIPVGSCYPCSEGFDKIHYNIPNNVECSAALVRSNPNVFASVTSLDNAACKSKPSSIFHNKAVFCPGFRWPPVICDPGFVSNADFTACVCPEGNYDNGNGACIPCEPGYFCNGVVKTLCPDDTYQDEYGSVDCKPCDDGDGNSFLTCGKGTDMLPAKCLLSNGMKYKTDRYCVKCSMCFNAIINTYSPIQNALQCYDN